MSANPFWEFSLDVYGRPGVTEACLALQDEAGLDVNMLLWCLWCAAQGPGPLTAEDLRGALAVTSGWQQKVVGPLRSARRAARDMKMAGGATIFAAAFQRDIAATELSAERVEQWLLFEEVSERECEARGDAQALPLACANLAEYLAQCGTAAGGLRPRLATLLGATFPTAGEEPVVRALAACKL